MTGLHLAPDLTLPEDAVTETFAILAKRGKGKTNTAVVMAEEMIGVGLPVVVLDPVGVWWGLRSSADGENPGLPVVIFGGDHADVPLEPTAGELIADVVVDQRLSAVIDLSSLSKSAGRRFMAPFVERLYHRNREALHVIVDEADAFAPQRATADTARLLGAMEDLVRRGRARGIGVTLITQRPAVLHKDVLTQAEVLIALGMTGPRDVAAIDEWVRLHADEDQAREVKASLPSLPVGTAWVWSPGWLDLLAKVRIRARRTFDSSATPKAGERRVTPKQMADVDLAALGEQIKATVERSQADNPTALRRRITDLERELAAERDKPPAAAVVERVEVPVLSAEIIDQLEALLEPAAALLGETQETLLKHRLWTERQIYGGPKTSLAARPAHSSTPGSGASGRAAQAPGGPPASTDPPGGQGPLTGDVRGDVNLKAGARRILETLAAHHPMRVTKSQLGTLARFKVTGGTFQTYWSALKRHGLVDESGGDIGITEAGLHYVGDHPRVPLTTDELLERWRSVLKAGARRMLDILVARYPDAVSREELADALEMAANGGTFQTYLSTLRRNGLATVSGGDVRAQDALFLGGGS